MAEPRARRPVPERATLTGLPELSGARVLVCSLGIEGRDLARWMLAQGAAVTMSDTRDQAALAAAGAAAPEGVERVVTGQELLSPEGFDVLAVSQSVLRSNPVVRRAGELGIPVTSQMRLFLQLCPGATIGVTGSSGKSTTTALTAAMAAEAGVEHVVGGNIGEPLLERLGEMTPSTTVILEVSHTQLQYTDRSTATAALTNVTPNHLDQFSWEEYVELKRSILAGQRAGDVAVLNADDPVSRELAASVRGEVLWCSLGRAAVPAAGPAAWVQDGAVMLRGPGGAHERAVVPVGELRLPGVHNHSNLLMASALAGTCGWPDEAIRRAVAGFRGIPHRLEQVGTAGGSTWVDDSIATTPERAAAGLGSFDAPVVLLAGGRLKNLPLGVLERAVRRHCTAVVCFGEGAEELGKELTGAVAVTVVATLEEAVAQAASSAAPGSVVLLSPAGTSFDAYPGFEARGEAFRAAVASLPGFEPSC